MILLRDGQRDEAIDVFLAEPEDSPARVLALGSAAAALGEMERYEEAERLGEQTLAEAREKGCPHPASHVQFSRNLAEAIRCQGRPWEAIRRFGQTVELAQELEEEHAEARAQIAQERAHTLQALGAALLGVERFAAALEAFQECRDVYREFPNGEEIGHAEVLTNIAYAFFHLGDIDRAAYALSEARQIATRTENNRQIQRINVVAGQLGLLEVSSAESHEAIIDGARQAARDGQFTTAYARYLIAAQSAIRDKNWGQAEELIAEAVEVEPRLPTSNLNPPRLRNMIATLREETGADARDVTAVLIEGANQWYGRLSNDVIHRDDFSGIAESMHDHFRRLANGLYVQGREEESLAAFEAGRALSLARDVAPDRLEALLAGNPFQVDQQVIDCSQLREACAGIQKNEVAISLAALPPQLVAFIVSREDVRTVCVRVGTVREEADRFAQDIGMIPHRLENGTGARGIPQPLPELAKLLAEAIGTRVIRRFVPVAFFHSVPWRTLLRYVGVPWEQLRFCTEFGLGLPSVPLSVDVLRAAGCVSMGHGRSVDIDFRDEAREFANGWGDGAYYEPSCTQLIVRQALMTGQNLMLSVHGRSRERSLSLEFADESVSASQLIPPTACAPAVFLSACYSGVYAMAVGDDPVGFAPMLLRAGVRRCVCTRWPVRALFARSFFPELAERLRESATLEDAFAEALAQAEEKGADLWRDIACLELIGRS